MGKRKLLVIDCENLYSKELINGINKTSNWDIKLVVGKNQEICESALTNNNIEIIRCGIIGKNQADFIVMALITRLMISSDYSKGYIASDDHGYDAAIEYLQNLGCNIARLDREAMEVRFQSDNTRYTTLKMTKNAACCIKKTFKSGTKYERILDFLVENYGQKYGKLIMYLLEDKKVIKKVTNSRNHTTQVYYSKTKINKFLTKT